MSGSCDWSAVLATGGYACILLTKRASPSLRFLIPEDLRTVSFDVQSPACLRFLISLADVLFGLTPP